MAQPLPFPLIYLYSSISLILHIWQTNVCLSWQLNFFIVYTFFIPIIWFLFSWWLKHFKHWQTWESLSFFFFSFFFKIEKLRLTHDKISIGTTKPIILTDAQCHNTYRRTVIFGTMIQRASNSCLLRSMSSVERNYNCFGSEPFLRWQVIVEVVHEVDLIVIGD